MITDDPKELGDIPLATPLAAPSGILLQPLTICRPDEILGKPIDDSDLILGDRLLAKGQALTMLGAGGVGKTRLALQLAACCIAGRPFLNLKTHAPELRWLFLQGENTNRRLRRDFDALKSFVGDDWGAVNDQLFVHALETPDDDFLLLDDPANLRRIAEAIARYEADVVVLDTLNCFASEDLNNDAYMRDVCRTIGDLCWGGNRQRAIIILHHALTGKGGAVKAKGYDRGGFGRNSKVLQAWCRGQINISPALPSDNNLLMISCGKCNNGEEFEPFAARLNTETMIYQVDDAFNWKKAAQMPARSKKLFKAENIVWTQIAVTPITKAAVSKVLQSTHEYSRQHSYKLIYKAVNDGLLTYNEEDDTYLAV